MLLERAASVWVSVMRFHSSNVFIAVAIAMTTAFFSLVASCIFVVAVPFFRTYQLNFVIPNIHCAMTQCRIVISHIAGYWCIQTMGIISIQSRCASISVVP